MRRSIVSLLPLLSAIGAPLGFALLAGLGCSSAVSSSPLPAAAATGDGGSVIESDEDASSGTKKNDASSKSDAAIERETEIVEVVGSSGGTCAEKCAAEGYECTPSCEY